MYPVAHHPSRPTTVGVALVLIVVMVVVSTGRADAAPPPTNFAMTLTADPGTGECVAQLTWEEGKGQIYVEMLLFADDGRLQARHAQKVSTSGDPRGSKSLTHVFAAPLAYGAGSGQVLDITISTARGKGGASGEMIGWVSMIATEQSVTCA